MRRGDLGLASGQFSREGRLTGGQLSVVDIGIRTEEEFVFIAHVAATFRHCRN
jgi:hypothetical protein